MPESNNSQMLTVVFGILVTICIGLSGSALKWAFDSNAKMEVMAVHNEQIKEAITELSKKSDLDKKQDATLSKHWRLHSWSRDEINRLRHKAGDEPEPWPDLASPTTWGD